MEKTLAQIIKHVGLPSGKIIVQPLDKNNIPNCKGPRYHIDYTSDLVRMSFIHDPVNKLSYKGYFESVMRYQGYGSKLVKARELFSEGIKYIVITHNTVPKFWEKMQYLPAPREIIKHKAIRALSPLAKPMYKKLY